MAGRIIPEQRPPRQPAAPWRPKSKSKLTPEQEQQAARDYWRGTVTQKQLAEEFGVTQATMFKIVHKYQEQSS